MKKRVSGRRRTRGGAPPPITSPHEIVADRKYKVYDNKKNISMEFRVPKNLIKEFKGTIQDPKIVSWMTTFGILTQNIDKIHIKIDTAINLTDEVDQTQDFTNIDDKTTPKLEKRKINVCFLWGGGLTMSKW
jgi:hypothetical protein